MRQVVLTVSVALVFGAPATAVGQEANVWIAPILGGADIFDGQRWDLVAGGYAGFEAESGFVQVGSEGVLAGEVDDPIARMVDVRAARSFGPVSAGVHFDWIWLGNRDRRGEVGGELSFQYELWGGHHDLGFAFGVGRGVTFVETTEYVQLGYFGWWPVEGRRGIFLKVHASYRVWRWDVLGAPMLEPAIGLRF